MWRGPWPKSNARRMSCSASAVMTRATMPPGIGGKSDPSISSTSKRMNESMHRQKPQ